jgi:hypothetical protein
MPLFNNIFGKPKLIDNEPPKIAFDINKVWFPFFLVMPEFMPRHHSYLAFNNLGKLRILILPDSYTSVAKGKLASKLRQQPESKSSYFDVAFVNEINSNDDASYLVPIMFSQDQVNFLADKFISCSSPDKLSSKLINAMKDNSIKNLTGDVLTSNADNFKEPQLSQRLRRIRFDSDYRPTNPDDTAHPFAGYNEDVPVFIYTFRDDGPSVNKDRFHRELAIRRAIETDNRTAIAKTINQLPKAESWAKRSYLLQTICKVEAELTLIHSLLWKSLGPIMLNPAFYQYEFPDTFRPLPEGTEAVNRLGHLWDEQTAFATTNWGEPNIIQLIGNVGDPSNWGTRKGMISPAITIFNDKFGIHTALTHLFVYQRIVGKQGERTKTIHSDDLETSQIPEIEWIPLGIIQPKSWWSRDIIAKKLIWLSVMHLCSHLTEYEAEVIFSVTPLGENAVQVSPAIAQLESGAPYAYLITQDENEITCMPVFTSDTFTYSDDGRSIVTNKQIFLKHYTITKDGIRKRDNSIHYSTAPVYVPVMTEEYKSPTYSTFSPD